MLTCFDHTDVDLRLVSLTRLDTTYICVRSDLGCPRLSRLIVQINRRVNFRLQGCQHLEAKLI